MFIRKVHHQESIISFDRVAQISTLNIIDPGLKMWTALAVLLLVLLAKNPLIPMAIVLLVGCFILRSGTLKFGAYLHFLSMPITFIMLSSLAIGFDYCYEPLGILHIPFLKGYFIMTVYTLHRMILVASRAFGAVSCLYFISLTTPFVEIVAALRKSHVPDLIIELMYLIYRYIFIVFSLHREMKQAAMSRVGYMSFMSQVRTTGIIYSQLLERSYRMAMKNFDAMESRCYEGEIRFLEEKKVIIPFHLLFAGSVIIVTLLAVVIMR